MSARVRVPVTLSLIKQAATDDPSTGPNLGAAERPADLTDATPETVAQFVEALKGSAEWLYEQVDLIAGLRGQMTQVSVEILEEACAHYRAVGEPARVFLAGLPALDLLAGLKLLYRREAIPGQPSIPTFTVHQGGRE